MKSRKIIFTSLVLLCMVMIFGFSNQTAKKSQSLSDEVAKKAVAIKSGVTKKEITEIEKENFIVSTRTLIRKSAHFTIYFVLGILLYLTFKSYNTKHPILYSILVCFLYACSDEIHQRFVSERTSRFLDVLIDTSGAFAGIIIMHLFIEKKNKFKKKIS